MCIRDSRWEGKIARVYGSPLIAELGKDWVNQEGALGRWRLRVRADGTRVGAPEFIPIASDLSAEQLTQASRKFADWLKGSQGPLGIIYNDAKVFNAVSYTHLDVYKRQPCIFVFAGLHQATTGSLRSLHCPGTARPTDSTGNAVA